MEKRVLDGDTVLNQRRSLSLNVFFGAFFLCVSLCVSVRLFRMSLRCLIARLTSFSWPFTVDYGAAGADEARSGRAGPPRA